MKKYELHVSVAYVPAGTKYYNSFKEYVCAETKEEAIKILFDSLKDEGYCEIDVTDIYEC